MQPAQLEKTACPAWFRHVSLTAAAAATAATAAIRIGDLLITRHPAKLQCHRHQFANLGLQRLQFTLRVHESNRHLVVKQRVTRTLELTNLRCAQLDACMLLLMQRLTALVDRLILRPRNVVPKKLLNNPLKLVHPFIGRNLGT